MLLKTIVVLKNKIKLKKKNNKIQISFSSSSVIKHKISLVCVLIYTSFLICNHEHCLMHVFNVYFRKIPELHRLLTLCKPLFIVLQETHLKLLLEFHRLPNYSQPYQSNDLSLLMKLIFNIAMQDTTLLKFLFTTAAI